MNNGDMPASPIFDSNSRLRAFTCNEGFTKMASGLTKRERFAMAVMQGLCSACNSEGEWSHDASTAADTAVEYADALLAFLAKEQQ